jgi:predicted transposase YdaD
MLNSDQIQRIYLSELEDSADLPIGLQVMLLTLKTKRQMPQRARALVEQAKSTPQNVL